MNAITKTLSMTAWAAEPPKPAAPDDLDKLVGQPVDLAPWAYAWRADLAIQRKPEAYFIPRRLNRIDTVYRTALGALGPDGIKNNCNKYPYKQDDILQPLLPAPKGVLTAGLLWVGGLSQYQVELHWPVDLKDPPAPEAVEVRVYPTAWGWFGWTLDRILTKLEISADRRTWIYRPEPGATMDWAYQLRVPAATEMVAVFTTLAPDAKPAVPLIRVTGPQLGNWKRMDVEIEWGFQAASAGDIQVRLETATALVGPLTVLPTDRGTTATGPGAWRSRQVGDGRRGINVPLVYAPEARTGLDSRITLWLKDAANKETGVTIRLSDLEKGPVLLPRHDLFVAKVGSGKTGNIFAADLAARNLKSVRQMAREHREAGSWEEAIREVRLWRCPDGTALPPFPNFPQPSMHIQVPDARWVGMWAAATDQLRGRHLWGSLAFEVAQVAHAMELVGLHDHANKIYDYFLPSPGVKADGDYSDPRGSLEWAKSMRHDMGYSHEGTHCSTGRLLFAMMERVLLTGDVEWFNARRARLQAAADWIVRERRNYLQDVPNRKDLLVAGLMPPCMLGDYALPSCDWHWYYVDNVFAYHGLFRFAEVLTLVDAAAGAKYRDEAESFRADIIRVVERDTAFSPVRQARDGSYRSFIPVRPYARGLMYTELGAPSYGGGRPPDLMMSGLPLGLAPSVMDPEDPRLIDSLDVAEEMGTLEGAKDKYSLTSLIAARAKKGLSTDDAWFWTVYVDLAKASCNANLYLFQDDIPNFLRFWVNESVCMVGSNGKLWEHYRPDTFAACDNPDNGTSGWFLYNFRNLLVMEDGQSLWLARGTPRAWLEQGKKIGIRNALTHFGTLEYEIVSDVDSGKITATVEMPARNAAPVSNASRSDAAWHSAAGGPSRKAPKEVVLRFRHPKSAPIQGVTVNGKPWTSYNKDKETITLKGLTGTVTVTAQY